VARLLELGELCEDHHMPEMDVGRARIDAELDPERVALRELLLQRAVGQHLLCPALQGVEVRHASARQ
jgi:hypothetical protein